ncbi:29268_t:CDS:2, partial [Gigaspora margarita]
KENEYEYFEASCHYYEKGKWQCRKPSIIEARLVLHCKEPDLEYSSNLTPFQWWGVVKDKNMHLQELAKTIFAIVPLQASYK